MLTVRGVNVNYYDEEIAKLDFVFERGVTLLLGEVGSFKTTLMRILGGVKEIKEGEIILDGENIEELSPRERNIAYVGVDTVPTGRTLGALMQPLKIRGVKRKEARWRALESANKFKVPYKKIRDLTEGELLSFFRARLSLRQTKVTMFDEPYHLLGENNAVTDMIKERSGYVIVSSCDGGDVERLRPDYLYVLRRDKVLASGKTDDILQMPLSDYISMFIFGRKRSS